MKTRTSLLFLFLFHFGVQAQYDILVSSGSGASSAIKRFDANGTFLGNFVAPGTTPLDWPQDIVFVNNRTEMLVSGLNNNAIFRFDGLTGALIDTFATNVSGPTRMKIGPDNYLYVLEWSGGNRVMRYDTTGIFIDTFTNQGVPASIGLDWDLSGNLYVSSYGGNSITRFDANGDFDAVVQSGPSLLEGPTNIWFLDNGEMIALAWNGNRAVKYGIGFTNETEFISSISKPEGYVYLPNGDLLIGSGGGASSIRRFDAAGNSLGSFASGFGLSNPNALYLLPTTLGLPTSTLPANFTVQPTVGTVFQLQADPMTVQDSFVLYSNEGQEIQTFRIAEDGYFDLSHLADGHYYLHQAQLGTVRLVVQHP
jgi:streptogramin lyase